MGDNFRDTVEKFSNNVLNLEKKLEELEKKGNKEKIFGIPKYNATVNIFFKEDGWDNFEQLENIAKLIKNNSDLPVNNKILLYSAVLEILTNSHDAIISNYLLKKKDYKGELKVKMFIKKEGKNKFLNLIIADNGAGKKAAASDEKKNNPAYIGKNKKGIESIKNNPFVKKFKIKIIDRGAVALLKYKIK